LPLHLGGLNKQHASFRGLWHKYKHTQTLPLKEGFSQTPAKKATGLPDYMEKENGYLSGIPTTNQSKAQARAKSD